jgi:hypothetical protein
MAKILVVDDEEIMRDMVAGNNILAAIERLGIFCILSL